VCVRPAVAVQAMLLGVEQLFGSVAVALWRSLGIDEEGWEEDDDDRDDDDDEASDSATRLCNDSSNDTTMAVATTDSRSTIQPGIMARDIA
jgi:hypothetical protein